MKKKGFLLAFLLVVMVTTLMAGSASAIMYSVGGRTLNVFGYLTQGIAFSTHGDQYFDTEPDVQALIYSLFLEGEYDFTDNFRGYGAFMLNGDWIYDFKHDDDTWLDRGFNKSRNVENNMYFDDEYWQLIKELHVTWTPGDFYFRIGKQIVKWGETIGFRLMDQINPADGRRGLADVEFESTIIPIWLFRAEYFSPLQTAWLTNLGFEMVFNPNADFIPDQGRQTGNDVAGIWAPFIELGPGLLLGSIDLTLDEPDEWSEGHEWGFRVKGILWNTIFTLNYFYGRQNNPVAINTGPPSISMSPEGYALLHPVQAGYYPRLRFVGATTSTDLQWLRPGFLGGVSPVLFLEAWYGFDNTFVSPLNRFEKYDELRYAIGIDWKAKLKFINPRGFVTIAPTFFHQKIEDYPSTMLNGLEDDNYSIALLLRTTYKALNLTPGIVWLQDTTNKAGFVRLQVVYNPTYHWVYTLGALFINGEERGKSLQVLEHKDQIYFRVSYRWG